MAIFFSPPNCCSIPQHYQWQLNHYIQYIGPQGRDGRDGVPGQVGWDGTQGERGDTVILSAG